MEGVGVGVELDVDRVRRSLTSGIDDLAIGVAERTGVALWSGIEGRIDFEVVEIGRDCFGLVVIEDNAIGQNGVADAEIKIFKTMLPKG